MSTSSMRSLEYLESMPGMAFARLYQQPSTVLAIFRRTLTHLAKTFVMAMLFLSHPIAVTDLESWVRPNYRGERDQALNLLERLKILRTSTNPGKPRQYSLTQPFAGSLRDALTGGGDHRSFGVPCNTPSREKPTREELDTFARNQWDGILGYMVGSAEGVSVAAQVASVSEGVKKLLRDGGLVAGKSKAPTITQEGFAFVLQDVNAQVWTILLLYLDAAALMNMDPVDVLSFLFMLGSLELGQDYSKANLSPTQTQMLDDLADFGLVYQTSHSSERFFPTRLSTTLTSDASALSNSANFFSPNLRSGESSSESSGFILVETNYRIYAYTSSPLQIAILQLFCRLSTRYPNMVAGRITRDSVRRAVGMGITSDQIISFLGTHAHPQMRKDHPVLPATVVDQIKLWQIENERMKATPGYLLNGFATAQEYEGACQYAREIGVLAWNSDERRAFFVTRIEQMSTYLKRGKQQQQPKAA
ncbi:MAG: hypothetical protein LQ340_000326 [Diploschistes diacapsis]|nr:MAG: hypothetical protein LQ340_000326 [Diploschistes diacapsis]